jgi:hypothetical protein
MHSLALSSWNEDEPSTADPRQFWRDISSSVTKRRAEANSARLALLQGKDYRGGVPGFYPQGLWVCNNHPSTPSPPSPPSNKRIKRKVKKFERLDIEDCFVN